MKPHIVVLHRWRDRYAEYPRYFDHDHYAVTYICREIARPSVPDSVAAAVTVVDLDDFAAVRAAVLGFSERFGHPHRIVGLHEDDLVPAAQLRQELDIPGNRPSDVTRFRDKLVMCGVISDARIPLPAFADAPDTAAVLEFADSHGWPVIVKPRWGGGSEGVIQLHSPSDAALLAESATEPRLVQQFCPDDILHIDGLWTGDDLQPWRASRYLTKCGDFDRDNVLSAVEIDDPDVLAHIEAFTRMVCAALSGESPLVFHLEAFLGREPDGTPRIQFLEIGARPGGAEIPFLWRDVHGYDLMAAIADIQLGRRPQSDPLPNSAVAGWLIVKPSIPAPCTVMAVSEPSHQVGGSLYVSVLPAPGSVLPAVSSYEQCGARFRFAGATSAEVEQEIQRIAADFRLHCEPGEASVLVDATEGELQGQPTG
ncbi:hypothetical protein AB0B25_03635 [Nocardia sp. NPDC049190]|uniref:ATP-grasp domain-containing protein n=1 Tax=Nocardia sp. NPDC049190 TaxID=3155650 RepID=UPI0034008422